MNNPFSFVPENWAQNTAANLHAKTDIQSSVKLEDLARWTCKCNYLLVSKCKLAPDTFKFLHTKMSTLLRKKTKHHTTNRHWSIHLQNFLFNVKCIKPCNSKLAYFRYQKMKIQPALRYIRYNTVKLVSLNIGHDYFLFFCLFLFSHPSCTPNAETADSDNNKVAYRNRKIILITSHCRRYTPGGPTPIFFFF